MAEAQSREFQPTAKPLSTVPVNAWSGQGVTTVPDSTCCRPSSLARELGNLGITVNAIAPGFVDTELTQAMSDDQRKRIAGRSALRRLPEADDVARTVEYLLGAGGRNISGSVLTVDAGSTA
jgi:3-oxoacyl-[acyl-carrier protein] reductase